MSEVYKKSYNLIRSNLQILQKSEMNCLIILSKAGLGKTTLVLRTMKDKGYQQDKHYAYYNSFFTPLAFFQTLETTTELKMPQILILDDVELILKDKNIINLLKGATWQSSEQDRRTITYSTTSTKVKNTRIDFTGKIILLLNEIPDKNPMFNAIMDRSLFVKLKFSNQEILELMEKEIIPKDYQTIKLPQRLKVFKFIRKHTTNNTDLSFRVLIKAYNYYMHAPANWQELTQSLLISSHPDNRKQTKQTPINNKPKLF